MSDHGTEPSSSDSPTPSAGEDGTVLPGPEIAGPGAKRWRRLPAGLRRAQRMFVPLFTVGTLIVTLVIFHSILLPFIFAAILVYLMEPLVRWLGLPRGERAGLPRWAAVVLVYIGFLTVVTTSLVVIVPRFVTEFVRFAESTPEAVTEFRNSRLPGLNAQFQEFVRGYVPMEPEAIDHEPARLMVEKARVHATDMAGAMAGAQARVKAASQVQIQWDFRGEPGQLTRAYVGRVPRAVLETIPTPDAVGRHGAWEVAGDETTPALRLVPEPGGGFALYWNDDIVEVVARSESSWVVRRHVEHDELEVATRRGIDVATIFDLERAFDEVIEGWLLSARPQLGAVVDFAQTFALRLIQIFLAIILTLMVAAFLSIDLPKFQAFARSMVPDDYVDGYDDLVRRMDVGLGGVVRGQLMICIVNGILTYIGLALLGVKYSVLLAVVAAVLSIIPVFGAVISTIPIVAMALTQSFSLGMLTLGWILMINFIEANFLNPKIIGTAAHIHPVIVIFALLAGKSAMGLVGAILAVPAASLVLALFGFIRDRYARSEMEDEAEIDEQNAVQG
jgi:predicted PurR-regulated permease PerM